MINMQRAALCDALAQVDQATQDHLEWHANLLRVIVCALPCDPVDVAPDAHRLCRFGQWFYRRVPAELRGHPVVAAIGYEHQHIHELAAGILRDVAAGRPAGPRAFNELLAGSLRMRRELDRLRRELQVALRSRDALTGAYDRDQALPELRRWHAPLKRGATSCCIAFMDLDRLGEINETLGHPTGDALLAEAVRFLCEHLRPDDKVFRYGGDEFLISLPGADLVTGQAVVTRVRDGFVRHQLFVAGAGAALHLSASFGIALLDPDIRVEDSIDHAAQALLLAKAAGGNRAISWDPSVTTGRHWRRLQVEEGSRDPGSHVDAHPASQPMDDDG